MTTTKGMTLAITAFLLLIAGMTLDAHWNIESHRTTHPGKAIEHTTNSITLTPVPEDPIQEDEPGFNCLTMGNHSCGDTTWTPFWGDIYDLNGGSHEDCLVLIKDPSQAVCPDGYASTR